MTRWEPQVIAHRGASGEEPEHTLAAYRRAIAVGADALECDVRLTLDGHLVCVHDRRVDRTSDGRGVVSALELARLQGLDWGSWKGMGPADDPPADDPSARARPADRAGLLTLRALFELVRDCDRDVRLAVETKHPNRYGGRVELALSRLLAEFGWDAPAHPDDAKVRVMSFSSLAVRRLGRLLPAVPRVLLLERLPVTARDGLPRGVAVAGIGIEVLRRHPRYVDRVRRAGGQVHVWVVDTPDEVDLCRRARVDGIITNRPDVVLGCLARL